MNVAELTAAFAEIQDVPIASPAETVAALYATTSLTQAITIARARTAERLVTAGFVDFGNQDVYGVEVGQGDTLQTVLINQSNGTVIGVTPGGPGYQSGNFVGNAGATSSTPEIMPITSPAEALEVLKQPETLRQATRSPNTRPAIGPLPRASMPLPIMSSMVSRSRAATNCELF